MGIPLAQGVRTNSIFQYFLVYSSVVHIYTIINPNQNCKNLQYNHTQYFHFTKRFFIPLHFSLNMKCFITGGTLSSVENLAQQFNEIEFSDNDNGNIN
jgi:hypothetical protein